jgi:hypothetical protein
MCSGINHWIVRPEGLGKFKNHLIRHRTRDLPRNVMSPVSSEYFNVAVYGQILTKFGMIFIPLETTQN